MLLSLLIYETYGRHYFRLLKIRKARKLSESPIMSEENVQKLRDFIIENRRQIPSFALSHFDRLEASENWDWQKLSTVNAQPAAPPCRRMK
ncbi:MAG: hypothetical protein ACLUKN_01760 [Bacilli bacterium]